MASYRKWNGAADNSITVACEWEGVEETVFLPHTQQNIRPIQIAQQQSIRHFLMIQFSYVHYY